MVRQLPRHADTKTPPKPLLRHQANQSNGLTPCSAHPKKIPCTEQPAMALTVIGGIQMDLFLEHPWAWFGSLQTVTQIIVGVCAFILLSILFAFFFAIDEPPSDPEKELNTLNRFAVGVLLELGLIIFFWPQIYYFFRFWLPYENFFIQMGSLLLVSFCMILIGHHLECGLLGGGFGKREYPSAWGGLQRERGLIWVTSLLLGLLSLLYAFIFCMVWLLSSLWDLVHKVF